MMTNDEAIKFYFDLKHGRLGNHTATEVVETRERFEEWLISQSGTGKLMVAAARLVNAVEKYAAPQPGEFLHRSDLLRTKDILKSLLR